MWSLLPSRNYAKKVIKKIRKENNNKLNKGYQYEYPLFVFSDENICIDSERDIINNLENRNPYYQVFDDNQNKLMIGRIFKLKENINFIIESIVNENENFNIEDVVSIYVYGSYVYGYKSYIPDDIDLGIIVKGSEFLYSIDNILVSEKLRNNLGTKAKYINYFVYGEDNMNLNFPVDDTVYAGVIHKDATKHEISVAYYRNIVLYGKDFRYLKGNLTNTYYALHQTLLKCNLRIDRYGDNNNESDKKCLKKIATRLYELNIFLSVFEPCYNIIDNDILTLPMRALNGESSIEEMKEIFNNTKRKYNNLILNKK
jgi:predicted nucleotidyltransferase